MPKIKLFRVNEDGFDDHVEYVTNIDKEDDEYVVEVSTYKLLWMDKVCMDAAKLNDYLNELWEKTQLV